MKNLELKKLLKLLKDNNIRSYGSGTISIEFFEEKEKTTVIIHDPNAKELKPSRTKEQEAEDLLFHSAGRV